MGASDFEHSPECGPIKVLKVLDSFKYRFQCHKCIGIPIIHKKLVNIVNQHKRAQIRYTPTINDFVIVEDIDTLYRGFITSRQRQGFYQVHLLDTLEVITVWEQDLTILPPEFARIKEQVHQLMPYGILPKINKKRYNAVSICAEIFSEAENIILKDYTIINGVYFGSIILKNGSKTTALAEILLKKDIALSSLNFEKDAETLELFEESEMFEEAKKPLFRDTSKLKLRDVAAVGDVVMTPQHGICLKALSSGIVISPNEGQHGRKMLKKGKASEKSDEKKSLRNQQEKDHGNEKRGTDLHCKHEYQTNSYQDEVKRFSLNRSENDFERKRFSQGEPYYTNKVSLSNMKEKSSDRLSSRDKFSKIQPDVIQEAQKQTATIVLDPNVFAGFDKDDLEVETLTSSRSRKEHKHHSSFESYKKVNPNFQYKQYIVSSDEKQYPSGRTHTGFDHGKEESGSGGSCLSSNTLRHHNLHHGHQEKQKNSVDCCSQSHVKSRDFEESSEQPRKPRTREITVMDKELHKRSSKSLTRNKRPSLHSPGDHRPWDAVQMPKSQYAFDTKYNNCSSKNTTSTNNTYLNNAESGNRLPANSRKEYSEYENAASPGQNRQHRQRSKSLGRSKLCCDAEYGDVFYPKLNETTHQITAEQNMMRCKQDSKQKTCKEEIIKSVGKNSKPPTKSATRDNSKPRTKSATKDPFSTSAKTTTTPTSEDISFTKSSLQMKGKTSYSKESIHSFPPKEYFEESNSIPLNSTSRSKSYNIKKNTRYSDPTDLIHNTLSTDNIIYDSNNKNVTTMSCDRQPRKRGKSFSRTQPGRNPQFQRTNVEHTHSTYTKRNTRCRKVKDYDTDSCSAASTISSKHYSRNSDTSSMTSLSSCQNSQGFKTNKTNSTGRFEHKESVPIKFHTDSDMRANCSYNESERHAIHSLQNQDLFTAKDKNVILKNSPETSINKKLADISPLNANTVKGLGRGWLLNAIKSTSSEQDKKFKQFRKPDPAPIKTKQDEISSNESDISEHSHDYVLKDKNNHEDRFYEIEEPTYLNCSQETDNSTEQVKNDIKTEDKIPGAVYEDLLKDTKEHEPVDNQALLKTTILTSKDGEQFEQAILSDYTIGQFAERLKNSCGIIHGDIKTIPISSMDELKLHTHIFTNIESKNMRGLTRSQMYAIPALLLRRNVILLGPPNSGKTLAYIIPILSLLLDYEYYKDLKRGNGPRCVFVSSSAQNVNFISQFCSAICGAKLTIITTHGGGLELERKSELSNGCEILVTTPRCWLRLLKHTTVTNLSRVCHVVFDDTDTLLETFLPEIREIASQLSKMRQIRKRYCDLKVQVVVVGEKWTPILEEISLRIVENPALCITAHLEAAIYAKVKPITFLLSPAAKLAKLKELLDNSLRTKTVIVCQNGEEVKTLRILLSITFPDVLIAHEDMHLNQIIEVANLWGRATIPIIVCSDPVLHDLSITNALWLIHYSMPDNKSFFSERFSTIIQQFNDRIKYPMSPAPECLVHIFIDDTNELQFPEVIKFMQRLSANIPEEISNAVKKINILKEERKRESLFCDNMLMFGKCWKADKCKQQHIFNRLRDTPKNLPTSGLVKVKVLYAHNPSHYSVRIIAVKYSPESQWVDFKTNYGIIALKMSVYYSYRQNRVPHGRVKIGDIVAVEVEVDSLFKRARVIDIVSRDSKLNPTDVTVHLMDDGTIIKYKTIQLIDLPSELQDFPQEAYEIYLGGLQPVDFDNSWSYASTFKIRDHIERYFNVDDERTFFLAKITLTIDTKLFTTSFLCYEWLESSKCHVVLFSPRKFILDTGLAVNNPGHLSTLIELAIEANIINEYPKDQYQQHTVQEENMEKPQWAFLEKEEFLVVHVIGEDTPSLFYLKLNKFSDRLNALHDDLNHILNCKRIKPDVIEPNMICAVKNSTENENKWNRALINSVTSSEADVFFVDYGDCLSVPLSDISLMPKGFVNRLPFQAIECSLVGIIPLNNIWLPEAVELFSSMTQAEDGQLKCLYSMVCEATKQADTTGGGHYEVLLLDTSSNMNRFLNKEFVYKGYANWNTDTKHHLTEAIPEIKKKEADAEEGSWEEEYEPVSYEPTSSPHKEYIKPTSSPHEGSIEPTSSPHKGSIEPTSSPQKGSIEPSPHKVSTEPTSSPKKGSIEPTSSPHKGSIEPTSSPHTGSIEPTSSPHTGSIEPTSSTYTGSIEPTSSSHKESIEPTSSPHTGSIEPTSSSRIENVDLISHLKNGDFDFEMSNNFLKLFVPGVSDAHLEQLDTCLSASVLKEKIGMYYGITDPQPVKSIEWNPNSAETSINSEKQDKTEISDVEVSIGDNSFCQEQMEIQGLLTPVSGLQTSNSAHLIPDIFHPLIKWHQTDYNVNFKIDIPDIVQYSVEWSQKRITFCCTVNEKYYWFELDLFGPIIPKTFEHSPKGRYLLIKMEKLIKGQEWPRLTFIDLKLQWIKLDQDYLKQDHHSLIEAMMSAGLNMSKKKIKNLKSCLSKLTVERTNGRPETDSDIDSRTSGSDDDFNDFYDMEDYYVPAEMTISAEDA